MHPLPTHRLRPAEGPLCAFAEELGHLSDPRDPRYSLAVLPGTLLVALAGGTDTMA